MTNLVPHNEVLSSIHIIDNHAYVTSNELAKVFNKAHHKVLRDIQNLDCSDNFRESNFGLSSYRAGTRTYKCYNITRDGFAFLAMGFTGKEAAEFKEAYINAFNQMESVLKALPESTSQPQADYNYPLYTADPTTRFCANAVLTSEVILNQRQPEMELLRQLEQDGYDVRGPKVRLETMYQLIRQYEEIRLAMDEFTHKVSSWADHYKGYVPNRGKNVVFERDGRPL